MTDTNRRRFLGILAAAGTGLAAAPVFSQQAEAPGKPERPPVDSPPVLQCPTETGIVVVWAVARSAAGMVEFGTEKDNLDRKATGDVTGLNAYHERYIQVRLEGLKPNTRYYYRTATAPFIFHHGHKLERRDEVYSDVYSFETPGPGKAETTFSVINDTHNNQKTYKTLTIPKVNEIGSDYTILNGDIVSSYDNGDMAVDAVLRPGGAAYATEHPMLFVMGNHDHRGCWARNLPLAAAPWDHAAAEDRKLTRNFVVRSGPLAMIGLDTGEDKPDWHPAWGGLAKFEPYRIAQRDWLERTLQSEKVATAPFVVAFCHIPIYDEDPNANGGDVLERWAQFQRQAGNLWGPLLSKYGVQILIVAHRHRFKYDAPNGDRTWSQLCGGGNGEKEQVTVIQGKATADRLEITCDELRKGERLGSWTFEKRKV